MHHARSLVVPSVLVVRTFDNHEEGVIKAPAHKRPVRAMPNATHEHHEEKVEVHATRRHAVTAQRDVQVIAEPAREGNVPALPEVRNANRAVRAVEVAREMEPEHKAKTNRHIRIGREVKVNLEHVGKRAPPAVDDARSIGRKNAVSDNAHLICKEDFFGKTKAEEQNTAHKVFERMRAGFKFFGYRIVTHNRARHKLREKCHVACECRKILDRRCRTAPHVNRVTHGLERVERNTHRQKDRHNRERFTAEHGRKIVHDSHAEHVILEESKCTEVYRNRRTERKISLELACVRRRDEPPRHVHHERTAEHKEHEPWFEPAVKNVAENGNEQVQERMLSPELEENKVADQKRRQEIEKKNLGRENH